MSASNVLAQIASTLTSLVHEDGTTTLRTIWQYPPEDPASGNFPALALEVPFDRDFKITPAAYQTGKGNDTYPVNLYLFVGAPAAGNLGELHTRAIGWRVPVYNALQANLNLNAGAAVIGDPLAGSFEMTGRVGGIVWSGVQLYGLVIDLTVTEYI